MVIVLGMVNETSGFRDLAASFLSAICKSSLEIAAGVGKAGLELGWMDLERTILALRTALADAYNLAGLGRGLGGCVLAQISNWDSVTGTTEGPLRRAVLVFGAPSLWGTSDSRMITEESPGRGSLAASTDLDL